MHNITYKTISYTVTLQFGLSEQLYIIFQSIKYKTVKCTKVHISASVGDKQYFFKYTGDKI